MNDPSKNKKMYATKEAALAAQNILAEEALEAAEKQNAALRAEVGRLRKEARMGAAKGDVLGRAVAAFGKRTKKQFASQRDLDEGGIIADGSNRALSTRTLISAGSPSSSALGASAKKATKTAKPQKLPGPKAKGSMQQAHNQL